MKKKVLTITVAVILILMLATPAIADALYTGLVRVINTGTSASGVSVNLTLDSASFIANGDMESDFSDVSMQYNGEQIPFMPGSNSTNPWIFFVPDIGSDYTLDYALFAKGAIGGKLAYFPDTGGMTVSDNDTSMEPGDNFTMTYSGYVDTTTTGSENSYQS